MRTGGRWYAARPGQRAYTWFRAVVVGVLLILSVLTVAVVFRPPASEQGLPNTDSRLVRPPARQGAREHVLLLGDSITQQGYMSGWVSKVSDALVRRAYVVNSGLSGYNTRWVLDVLNDPARRGAVIPEWLHTPLFTTLLLGSNDLARSGQHVPLDEFRDNMKALARLVLRDVKPQGGLFIITPPPIHENWWNVLRPDEPRYYRDARVYRQAVVDVVAELRQEFPNDVFLVDMHRAFMQYGAPDTTEEEMEVYNPDAAWTGLCMPDGLHINNLGGQVFAATLLEAIRATPKGADVLYNAKDAWPLPDWRGMRDDYIARHP